MTIRLGSVSAPIVSGEKSLADMKVLSWVVSVWSFYALSRLSDGR
jgi:hypothetical protein